MKNILWLSDTHFDSISNQEYFTFIKSLSGDALLFTGDISTGVNLIDHLIILLSFYKNPVYLVLGNHDLWRKFRKKIKKGLENLKNEFPNFHYLTSLDFISFSSEIALVGDDSWYDPGPYKPILPVVYYWDWYHVLDFRALFSVNERYSLMSSWATQSAERIKEKLIRCFEHHQLVYLALHVPPWPDKVDNISSFFWKPYNSSNAISSMLEELMRQYNNKHLIVVSGHTHHLRREKITHNIELRVAQATCGKPQVQEEIWV